MLEVQYCCRPSSYHSRWFLVILVQAIYSFNIITLAQCAKHICDLPWQWYTMDSIYYYLIINYFPLFSAIMLFINCCKLILSILLNKNFYYECKTSEFLLYLIFVMCLTFVCITLVNMLINRCYFMQFKFTCLHFHGFQY